MSKARQPWMRNGLFVAAVFAAVAALIVARLNYISGMCLSIVEVVNRTFSPFMLFILILVAIVVAGALLLRGLSPGHRLHRLLVPLLRRVLEVSIDDAGAFASSAIVFTRIVGDHAQPKLFTLLDRRPVDNDAGAMRKMYPGRRLRFYDRPDTAPLSYIRDVLHLDHVQLSPQHHTITGEVQFPRDTTTRVPRPFLVLIERQPQRGGQAYNYDLIYVALYQCKDATMLDKPPSECEWRAVEAIRKNEQADMLEDVRAAILKAADVMEVEPTTKGNHPEVKESA